MTNAQLVTLCSRDSVAARMFAPEFGDALRALLVRHGMSTAQLVTFVNDCVAARLGTPEFDDAVSEGTM